jgi:hypothetical protein
MSRKISLLEGIVQNYDPVGSIKKGLRGGLPVRMSIIIIRGVY